MIKYIFRSLSLALLVLSLLSSTGLASGSKRGKVVFVPDKEESSDTQSASTDNKQVTASTGETNNQSANNQTTNNQSTADQAIVLSEPSANNKQNLIEPPLPTSVTTTTPVPTPTKPLTGDEDEGQLPLKLNKATTSSGSLGLLVRTAGALLLVIGLLIAGTWAVRRFGGKKFNGAEEYTPLNVLSTVSLGDQRTLTVVRFKDRMLLLGATAQSINLLVNEQFEAPDEVRAQNTIPKNARSVAELLGHDDSDFEQELTASLRSMRTRG